MMTLFDQEYLTSVYVKEQRDAALAEGISVGAQNTQRSNALRMHEQGCPADSIAKMLGLSIEVVNEWLSGETVPA